MLHWMGGGGKETGSEVTHLVKVPSKMKRNMCVSCNWLDKCVSNELGAV